VDIVLSMVNADGIDCISSIYRNPGSLTELTVVLDLDETLVHTFENMNDYNNFKQFNDIRFLDLMTRSYVIEMNDVSTIIGQGYNEKLWGITRPYVEEFLKFAFGYFKYVIVWSAGLDRYVQQIVEKIFSRIDRPDVIYGRSKCSKGTTDDNRVFNHKPLARLIKEQNLDIDMSKIILVDDKLYSFTDNPDNSIFIPGYIPEPTINSMRIEDTELVKLMYWLLDDNVMYTNDIRLIDRSNIFDQNISVTINDVNKILCNKIIN